MRKRMLSAAVALGVALCFGVSGVSAQQVAKRTAKRAAKEATESAAKEAAEDVTKKAVKKAMAPDALDLNSATPEQMAKLGLDEATVSKIVAARPFASLEDPKVKEAIPAEVLKKLEGKVTVKPQGPAQADPQAPAPAEPQTAPPPTPPQR
jgi:DNA uptake protein ComE-like DNA-binding protein